MLKKSGRALLRNQKSQNANLPKLNSPIMRISQVALTREGQQAKIFASMCPDEILDYYDSYDMRSYETTLMLGDVSGFTDMTEKFTKSGKGGPSKLTDTLNSYIGAMVQEILSHGGDVLKFSGDAFIVMWKLTKGRLMRDIATEAIHTACIIQKHFGTYKTEIDVELKVKLAIASGRTYFTSIGDPKLSSYYIIIGKPVWEVKFAEGLCRGGDILVAPSCWQYVNPNEYVYKLLPDGVHIHITSLSVLWHSKNSYNADNFYMSIDAIDSEGSTGFSDLSSSSSSSNSSKEDEAYNLAMYASTTTDYTLRSKIILAGINKLNNELRCYVPRPVIRSIEMNEPMEYLTEIRHVVIVFVNVITKEINRRTLIQVVQTAYKFVCSIVNEMQGCVNKTSLFDKDLLFLCVFGLRGDKHELESQIGLRCASLLRRGLSKYRHIDSVTVGVTTGMTYCGVVGHVLRREYTVIGMAVNKAARLMCAYTNKVVCDRESFLQSHLEARHFILQEPKHLKGITKVGPIYEFSEQSSVIDHEFNVCKYPLLGRDDELLIFLDTIEKLSQGSHQHNEITNNVMILRGDPRIGKTRLLEELAHITCHYVRINFVSLAPTDQELPFVLLRLILDGLLDLAEVSEVEFRESQLQDLLVDAKEPLCLLNQIFAVNFSQPDDFKKMTSHMRKKRLRRLLRRLIQHCARSVWLVIVDDAELADEDSLAYISDITRYKSVLFILAYGNKLSKDYVIPENINSIAKFVELHGLDKWFHTGLACQIMNVVAIPAELEKAIQERSWGNPGWIESYLISLEQSRSVVIEKMTDEEIHKMGLAVPSSDMLRRPSGQPKLDHHVSNNNEGNNWKMFRFTFKESYGLDQSKTEKRDNHSKHNVCRLTSEFTLGEGDAETTMDTILVKLYDSLTPLDQYFIKCAAVLGEVVDRKMLRTLMRATPEREIALCVVKLFELRIIGCAVGDFSRSPGPMMLFKKSHTSNVDIQARCGCKNIKISKELADLPNYASCRLMRFKLDMFRETTYGLLTENQKVEFHSKALYYLQQNARRCHSCGGGQFNILLGESAIADAAIVSTGDPVIAELTRSTSMTEKITGIYDSEPPTVKKKKFFSSYKQLVKSPTRTFSHIDLSNCDCNLILLTLYTQVLEHCRGIKIKTLLLVAILEFVVVCISTLNIPQATKLLHEADQLIEPIYNAPEDALLVLPCIKAKVMTLRGQCFLESGLLTEAMTCFEKTLSILGYKFPTSRTAINLKAAVMLRQLFLTLTVFRHLRIGVLSGDEANFTDQFARCLALMFILFRMKGMYEHAKLAAIWGLYTALASNKDFLVLCPSYAHMMVTAHDYQYKTIIPLLEMDALNLCAELGDSIETRELRAIAELYACIFESRWLRGFRFEATSIGHIAVRLTTASASYDYKLVVLPKVIQLITSQSLFEEAILLLQELEVISQTSMDLSGSTWYYALCVNLLLESGISMVSLRECEEFYQQESSKIMDVKDVEAAQKFFICMWLWYIRIRDWESAYVWKDRQSKDLVFNEYTVTGAIIVLQKLEGLIINYVARVEYRNYNDAKAFLAEIKAMIKDVHDIHRVVKITNPRYYLMKAYYNMVIGRRKTGMGLVRKAKKLAYAKGNLLIYEWAVHSEKAWLGTLSTLEEDSWKETCMADQAKREFQKSYEKPTALPYTLPIIKNTN